MIVAARSAVRLHRRCYAFEHDVFEHDHCANSQRFQPLLSFLMMPFYFLFIQSKESSGIVVQYVSLFLIV